MRPELQRELAHFTTSLDQGDDAVLPVSVADQLVKQLMLLNWHEKAPKKAEELGVHARTFNRYQTGEQAPTLHRAVRLIDSLGYEVVIRKKT